MAGDRIEQRLRLRAEPPLSGSAVLVRGGPDPRDKLARHARRTTRAWSLDGQPLLGISVFAVSDISLEELLSARFATYRVIDRPASAALFVNLAQALLMTGDWDTADAELARAIDGDGLAGIEFVACNRAWVAALRGDTETARAALAGLEDLRASEDPQDQATIAAVEAFTAAARRRAALRPRHPRPGHPPGHQLGFPAVGVAAGRPRPPRPRRYRHDYRAARDARRLPARTASPDAARRTRPDPRPPHHR